MRNLLIQRRPVYVRVTAIILITGALLFLFLLNRKQKRQETFFERNPETRELRIAIELSPITLYTADDTIRGFSYELINRLAETKGFKISFSAFSDIKKAFHDLRKGQFDILISNTPATANLKRDFLLTEPVFTDHQVLIQRKDSLGKLSIKNQQDLSGKEIWIVSGSTNAERLRNLSDEIGRAITLREINEYSEEQLVYMVAVGNIPLAATSASTAKTLENFYPGLDSSVDLSFNQFKSWIVNPTDLVLLDSLNRWIIEFKNTDEYSHLKKKYFLKN